MLRLFSQSVLWYIIPCFSSSDGVYSYGRAGPSALLAEAVGASARLWGGRNGRAGPGRAGPSGLGADDDARLARRPAAAAAAAGPKDVFTPARRNAPWSRFCLKINGTGANRDIRERRRCGWMLACTCVPSVEYVCLFLAVCRLIITVAVVVGFLRALIWCASE